VPAGAPNAGLPPFSDAGAATGFAKLAKEGRITAAVARGSCLPIAAATGIAAAAVTAGAIGGNRRLGGCGRYSKGMLALDAISSFGTPVGGAEIRLQSLASADFEFGRRGGSPTKAVYDTFHSTGRVSP
jgi:hypothetical protein